MRSITPMSDTTMRDTSAALHEFLRNENLEYHGAALWARTTLGSLIVQTEDRPSLLARLKSEIGMKVLSERQRLATALSRLRRAGENRKSLDPAAVLPILQAPGLIAAVEDDPASGKQHPSGTHGLLITAAGTLAHVNGAPPMRSDDGSHCWITHGTRLDGPVVALVIHFAAELGRPVFVPFCDEDPGLANPHSLHALPDEAVVPKRDAWLAAVEAAFGPRVLVLTTALHLGVPSHSRVRLMPCFDSWMASTTELPSAHAVSRPFASRVDRAVWRGVPSGSLALAPSDISLRSKVLNYLAGRPWVDAKYGGGMFHGDNWLTLDELAAHKVILAVDGNAWASTFEWGLASGSVIVSIGVWHHSVTSLLRDGEHFVAARADLSDLEERVHWVFRNPEEAAKIAACAREAFLRLANPKQTIRSIVAALTPLELRVETGPVGDLIKPPGPSPAVPIDEATQVEPLGEEGLTPLSKCLATLLPRFDLAHLCAISAVASADALGAAELCAADRPAFLRRFSRLGIESLNDRQQLANSLLRSLRAGKLQSTGSLLPRPTRIAFLFLVYEGLPHEALWRAFFEHAQPELYGVYLHSKAPCKLQHFSGCHIDARVPTDYGKIGIVNAELALLRAALSDGRNAKFILCSDSCIPLKTFAHVYRSLTKNDQCHFAEFSEPIGSFASRLEPLRDAVPRGCLSKHSQWWVLNRRVAVVCTSQSPDYMMRWSTCDVPDEHFFLTTVRHDWLAKADDFWDADAPTTPGDVTCHAAQPNGDFTFPTHVCWSGAERSPPLDWNGEPALRPRTYTALTRGALQALLATPALFARKMAAGCNDLDALRAIYANDERDESLERAQMRGQRIGNVA